MATMNGTSGPSAPWVVLKLGGTSVASPDGWRTLADRIRRRRTTHRVWVVCSALAGVTSRLEAAIRAALTADPGDAVTVLRGQHQSLALSLGLSPDGLVPVETELDELDARLTGIRLTGEAPPRLVARILATGERCATHLGVAALDRLGIEARWVDARELLRSVQHPMENDHHRFLEARVPVVRDPERMERAAGGSPVVVTQGFIASTPNGETCLLGRGGSDTSAALFAALGTAGQLEIWTDVHGLFTADPRLVPSARLIERIGYREAQELAAMGAKVLHPRCLEPVAASEIPLTVHHISDPEAPGTRVEGAASAHPAVTAVTCRTGVTLISISSVEMWGTPGYLARVFQPFEELGISVDLVATSQTTVSVTLDRGADGPDGTPFARLVQRLEAIGQVRVQHPVAVVSIVGRRIRAVLHELGPALGVFRDRPVHMVSDSVDDLNLSFVTDEPDARTLVVRLHDHLFGSSDLDPRFGPSWEELGLTRSGTTGGQPAAVDPSPRPWWRDARERLVDTVADGRARYVYHLPSVIAAARRLRRSLPSVARVYYAMKANPHPAVLTAVTREGLGLECVSLGEVAFARETVGPEAPVLFTPNFCPPDEYVAAFAAGAEVVVDGPEILGRMPEVFAGREIGIRLDPGRGLGHSEKVQTAGAHAKFGHPLDELRALVDAARSAGATIIGLHAHVGSGVHDPDTWATIAGQLAAVRDDLPELRWIDVGGGLGVPERRGQAPLDLDAVETGLAAIARGLDGVELRIEPGRYLVSEAGVLVSPVTQVRRKGALTYAGLATGMNSLIRPALYGAWHAIVNLTRLDDPPSGRWQVVGPICESGDVFGRDRLLPETRPGDVLLIANAGAYGAAMASRYNLRTPATEIVFED